MRTGEERFNKISGQNINNENIIFSDQNGIVESISSGWKLTPADEVDKKTTNVSGPYIVPEIPVVPIKNKEELYNSFNTSDNSKATTENKMTYFFGIDSLLVQNKIPDITSGITFHSIHIGHCSFIQLSADIILNDKNSVDIYIVDGTKEIPILPIENKKVNNEKLFFNLPTRFTVDTRYDVEIKKDGQVIKRTIEGLESLDLQSGLYTISYTPLNAYNYYPENETISIKVIQRLYDVNAEPPYIKNLLIHKHGGGLVWIE